MRIARVASANTASRAQGIAAFKHSHAPAHASLALALFVRAHSSLALALALFVPALALFVGACARPDVSTTSTFIGESPISVFTLSNARGLQVRVMEYGATILSIRVPDRRGRIDDVVLGFDSLADYLTSPRYFGAVVGRYGNRIAQGRFVIDGTTYELARNNGPNHLHGGRRGFDKVIWKGQAFQAAEMTGVVLRYTSPAGEEGYPGKLKASVTYTLTPRNELVIDYTATTDAETHVNLTQHSFFNLAGAGVRDVLEHELTLYASRFTPVDSTSIPTGELAPVAGTPFDFLAPHPIGERIAAADPQLRQGNGYNHNFVLDRNGDGMMRAARVREPTTGRTLEVFTTEPGIQFFTGNSLDGTAIGKGGRAYHRHYGFCLETQHFPDTPNRPSFPSTLLRPGQVYKTRTVFRFGTT
jgi:aldose 1-epimerase